jgi:hypothetical protein
VPGLPCAPADVQRERRVSGAQNGPFRRDIDGHGHGISQRTERRLGARLSRDLLVSLAALSSPGIAQWTVSRAVYLYISALEVNVLNCRRQGHPGSPGAGTLYPQLHAARGPSSWRRNRSPVTVPRASGENPGQDDPDAAGVLDLDSGPEMGTSPGSSNGPEPGRRPCPGTPWRSRPPRPRPPGRRRIRLPQSVRPLSRHHAERRER